MVVDATLPVLVSLALLLAVSVTARLVERRLATRLARRAQGLWRAARSLACPRIVLLDEIGHPVRAAV